MGVVGRYVDRLTPEQEDRVLTVPMYPGSRVAREDNLGPCLIGVAEDFIAIPLSQYERIRDHGLVPPVTRVEWHFDMLCGNFSGKRKPPAFGKKGPSRTAQINDMIRNRILRNRVRRALTVVQVEEVARG